MSASGSSLKVEKAEARQAAGRSGLYSLLARLLAVPDEDLHSSIINGELARMISEIEQELPYPLQMPDLAEDDLPPFVEFQADYIAFFDVGMKGPPCPLYEGAFRKDRGRKAIMEDLLRFYHHFDLKMSEETRELPDQLSAELEFMHYLAYLETGLCENSGGDSAPRLDLIRAQRDFLSRHLAGWAPELAGRAVEREAPKFYRIMLRFLESFISADLAYLEGIIAEAPSE